MKPFPACLLAAALWMLPACKQAVADIAPITKITVENRSGKKVDGLRINAEAFRFDVPSLENHATFVQTESRIGGNCGVLAISPSGMTAIAPLPLGDGGKVVEVKLIWDGTEKLDASYRLEGKTAFVNWP